MLHAAVLLCVALPAAHAVAQAPDSLSWVDATALTLEGRGFAPDQLATPYDRLPARAEAVVRPPVWDLSRDSAGLAVRFTTRASELRVRYRLRRERLAMAHMPATGVSGVDLYTRRADGGWRWLAVVRPSAVEIETRLVGGLPETGAPREYLLYLPLYNGVTRLEVGVPEPFALAPATRPRGRPIVFYGTSITQGGCASRPGAAHVAQVGRHFDRPVVNLGFSGNGRLEPEVGALLAEIDAVVYVIDCLPNVNAAQVRGRLGPLVRALRAARPATPILLVQDRIYDDAWLVAPRRRRNADNHAAFDAVVAELRRDGIDGLHVLRGADLLGDDGEATVDGSHPNDLGFARLADAFTAALRPLVVGR